MVDNCGTDRDVSAVTATSEQLALTRAQIRRGAGLPAGRVKTATNSNLQQICQVCGVHVVVTL